MAAGSHTIRPAAPTWRSGDDGRRHAIFTTGAFRGACGVGVLTERYDRTDQSRCIECLARVGIDVTARLPWTESELRLAHGDR